MIIVECLLTSVKQKAENSESKSVSVHRQSPRSDVSGHLEMSNSCSARPAGESSKHEKWSRADLGERDSLTSKFSEFPQRRAEMILDFP
jgi:hypothetical protein